MTTTAEKPKRTGPRAHHFRSNNGEYILAPIKTKFNEVLWQITWVSSVGPIRLTSLGTPANDGHAIPYYADALVAIKRHARQMGDSWIEEFV